MSFLGSPFFWSTDRELGEKNAMLSGHTFRPKFGLLTTLGTKKATPKRNLYYSFHRLGAAPGPFWIPNVKSVILTRELKKRFTHA